MSQALFGFYSGEGSPSGKKMIEMNIKPECQSPQEEFLHLKNKNILPHKKERETVLLPLLPSGELALIAHGLSLFWRYVCEKPRFWC